MIAFARLGSVACECRRAAPGIIAHISGRHLGEIPARNADIVDFGEEFSEIRASGVAVRIRRDDRSKLFHGIRPALQGGIIAAAISVDGGRMGDLEERTWPLGALCQQETFALK